MAHPTVSSIVRSMTPMIRDLFFPQTSQARIFLSRELCDEWLCRQAIESRISKDSMDAGDGGADSLSFSA
jgi:hypothetical protein